MRALLAAALLLSACPEPREVATRVHKSALRWPPHVMASAFESCSGQGGSEADCDCLCVELEKLSPDPETKVTRAEARAALKACGLGGKAKGDDL